MSSEHVLSGKRAQRELGISPGKIVDTYWFIHHYCQRPLLTWGHTRWNPDNPGNPVYPHRKMQEATSEMPGPVIWHKPFRSRGRTVATHLEEENILLFALRMHLGNSAWLVSYRLESKSHCHVWEPYSAKEAYKLIEPQVLVSELA